MDREMRREEVVRRARERLQSTRALLQRLDTISARRAMRRAQGPGDQPETTSGTARSMK